MDQSKVFVLVFVGALLLSTNVFAEDNTASDESGESSEGSEGSESSENGEQKKERRKHVRLPFLSLAVEAGLLFFPELNLSATDALGNKQTMTISSRSGLIVKIHLNVLGSGLAIELAPFIGREWTGDDDIESFGTVGGQLGLSYRFRIKRFYPKIGIGAHVAYLGGDDIDYGLEAYGRIPIGFTWYFLRFLALEFEVAPMFGATGIKTDGIGVFDNNADYDAGWGLEFVLGFRFP